MTGPLSGMRVIDLTAVVLGPYAMQVLCDMGADVIKVEAPGGDILRDIGPSKNNPHMAPVHLTLNRGKRSLLIDLKKPGGREALMRVVAGADAFVHSMRAQAATKLGLDYESIRAVRPDIVYCAAYGFGEGGPYADRPAYDDMIQGMAGMADLMARVTDGVPQYAPTILADKTVGLVTANAVLAGLLHRARTGEGQAIEVPMFETLVSYLMVEHLWLRAQHPDDGQVGYVRTLAKTRRPYRTADGYICVLAYTDRHWRAFFELGGRPELADDPRFVNVTQRTANIETLYAIADEMTGGKTSAEWLELLEKASIPHGPANRLEDLLTDPHLVDRKLFRRMQHPTEGDTLQVAPPVNFSRTPAEIRGHAPLLGEQSVEILADAGFSQADIDRLLTDGVIGVPPKQPSAAD